MGSFVVVVIHHISVGMAIQRANECSAMLSGKTRANGLIEFPIVPMHLPVATQVVEPAQQEGQVHE